MDITFSIPVNPSNFPVFLANFFLTIFVLWQLRLSEMFVVSYLSLFPHCLTLSVLSLCQRRLCYWIWVLVEATSHSQSLPLSSLRMVACSQRLISAMKQAGKIQEVRREMKKQSLHWRFRHQENWGPEREHFASPGCRWEEGKQTFPTGVIVWQFNLHWNMCGLFLLMLDLNQVWMCVCSH